MEKAKVICFPVKTERKSVKTLAREELEKAGILTPKKMTNTGK
jgi:hypothetical protein